MRKRIRSLCWILLVLAVLGLPAGERRRREPLDAAGTLEQLDRDMARQSGEQAQLQENLARWYNLNLLLGDGAEPVERAYPAILCFSDGIMASIEIPKLGLLLPIYHSPEAERGVTHMEGTALPIGGTGNHTVLVGPAELPEGKVFGDLIFLEEGDLFYIHILGSTLTYRVTEVGTHHPGKFQPVPGEDRCTLLMRGKDRAEARTVAVSAIRREETPGKWPESRCMANTTHRLSPIWFF